MAGKYVEPSISSLSFNCPHCGAHAGQTWFDLYCDRLDGQPGTPWRASTEQLENIERNAAALRQPDPILERVRESIARSLRGEVFLESDEKTRYRLPKVENLSVSRCYACRRVAVWLANGVIYPPVRNGAEPSDDMPDDVRADYEEARTIVALSPRGAAALLRLAIQKLCDRLGENGKKLDDAIASLVTKGLDRRVQQALDIVRVVGNEAVHPGQMDLRDDQDTATELFRLVNLIVEVLISQPKHVEEMYGRLPESKRKAIEARDKRGSS